MRGDIYIFFLAFISFPTWSHFIFNGQKLQRCAANFIPLAAGLARSGNTHSILNREETASSIAANQRSTIQTAFRHFLFWSFVLSYLLILSYKHFIQVYSSTLNPASQLLFGQKKEIGGHNGSSKLDPCGFILNQLTFSPKVSPMCIVQKREWLNHYLSPCTWFKRKRNAYRQTENIHRSTDGSMRMFWRK